MQKLIESEERKLSSGAFAASDSRRKVLREQTSKNLRLLKVQESQRVGVKEFFSLC